MEGGRHPSMHPWTLDHQKGTGRVEPRGQERDWLLLGEVRAGVVEGCESP